MQNAWNNAEQKYCWTKRKLLILNSEQKIIYAEKRVNNFLNNAKQKIILCRILEIVYVENNEQFLWENNEHF